MSKAIELAKEHFGKLLEEQLQRVERMKQAEDWIDYTKGIRKPMPSIYDHLFRLTDRSSDKQLDVIKKIKMEICSDTDVECPTCEGKGYLVPVSDEEYKEIMGKSDEEDED